MPSSIDPARLASLPADLRAFIGAQAAMLEAERRRADDERAARLHVESERDAFKETVARLELLVKRGLSAHVSASARRSCCDPDQETS